MKDNELLHVEQGSVNSKGSSGEIEIDLLELFYRLLENAKKIIIGAVVGMLILGIYSFFIATPKYEATCRLYVNNASGSAIDLTDLQIGSYLATDYTEVFTTWEVREMVLQNLDLDYTYEDLEDMLTVSNPSNTRILDVRVISEDPQEAKDMANEYANVARSYISRTMDTSEPAILSSALVPDKPVSPRKALNTLLGFVAGALIMGAFVTVQFLMDDKIKTADDIRKYVDMAALAIVPSNNDPEKADRKSANGRKQRR